MQDRSSAFFTIMDGHGGAAAAEYTRRYLYTIYQQLLQQPDSMRRPNSTTAKPESTIHTSKSVSMPMNSTVDILQRAFQQLDRQFLEHVAALMARGQWQVGVRMFLYIMKKVIFYIPIHNFIY